MDISLQTLAGIGLVLCALVLGQFALWTSASFRRVRSERKQFGLHQQSLRSLLPNNQKSVVAINGSPERAAGWKGYREFFVQQMVRETPSTVSVYLRPADGKPIASFRPGQHVTVRLSVPGQAKPLVRCYSLSDSPNDSYYRITVKEVPPPNNNTEIGFGKASHYVNRLITEGQSIELKTPAGDFVLNEESQRLVVLLAGGVGITPMISMLNRLVDLKSPRTALLVYGIQHGQDHPFKQHLSAIARTHENIHVLTCYSQPGAVDRLGADYQFHGRVNLELLKRVIGDPDAEFYMCGPAAFMQSLYDGLLEWGVYPKDIHFEAFGPASVKRASAKPENQPEPAQSSYPVKFLRSETVAVCDGQQTLLELAEAQQIPVDSGCRAGSCGTCCVALINGEVEYPAGQNVDCPAGHCLMCIARPKGAVELDV